MTLPHPSLLYHKVSPEREIGVTQVTPMAFKKQMLALKTNGWIAVGLDDDNDDDYNESSPAFLRPGLGCQPSAVDSEYEIALLRSQRRHIAGCQPQRVDSLPNQPMFLIFDDGYECIHRWAWPVLSEIGFCAAVFVPAGYIGRWNDWDYHFSRRRFKHLDIRMIKDLHSSGWTIGSHTVSHRDLHTLNPQEIEYELRDSRQKLEDIVGAAVNWLAFPFGRYNLRVIEQARACGYKGAVTPLKTRFQVEGFQLLQAEAVYIWDRPQQLVRRLERKGFIYRLGNCLRWTVNFCNHGTTAWRRMFPLKVD